MAKYDVELIPNSDGISGWSERTGNWVVNSDSQLITSGTRPAEPRFLITTTLTPSFSMMVEADRLTGNAYYSGIVCRYNPTDGSFVRARFSTENWWVDYWNGSEFESITTGGTWSRYGVRQFGISLDDTANALVMYYDGATLDTVDVTGYNEGSTEAGLIASNVGNIGFNTIVYSDTVEMLDISKPTIDLVGDETVYSIVDETYADAGAIATDPDGNALAVTTVSTVDENTIGDYTVTHSVTYNGFTKSVVRNVIVRPANYVPVFDAPGAILVASGAAVTITPEFTDNDTGDTHTLTLVQSGSDANQVAITANGDGSFSFNAPEVTVTSDLNFIATVTDQDGASDTTTFVVSVKANIDAQRITAKFPSVSKQVSSIVLDLPDRSGFEELHVNLTNHESKLNIVYETLEFDSGKLDIQISSPRGVPFIGTVSELNNGGVFPPNQALVVAGASTGQIEIFANDIIQNKEGILPVGVTAFGANKEVLMGNSDDKNYPCPSGAMLTYKNTSQMYYTPNGAFDYLDPNETAIEEIIYWIGDVQNTLQITVKASEQVGANIAGTPSLVTSYAFVEGKLYEFSIGITGRTAGEITPQFTGSVTKVAKYGFSRNGREVWKMKAPAGTTALEFVASNGWDGEVESLYVRELLMPTTPVEPRRVMFANNWKSGEPTNAGKPTILACIVPLYDLSGGLNDQDIFVTGAIEGATGITGYGVRNTDTTKRTFKLLDYTCSGQISACSLKGGDYTVSDGGIIYGGYPTEVQRFSTGFVLCDTNGDLDGEDIMHEAQIMNTMCDMLLDSHRGNYAEGSNSDCIVHNSSNTDNGYKQVAYTFNCWLRHAGDGIIDTKHLHQGVNLTMEGGYRTLRHHGRSMHVIVDTDITGFDDTQCELHVAVNQCRQVTYNSTFRGERIIDQSDYGDDKVLADISIGEAYEVMYVAKTLPRIMDTVRYAHDTLVAQYKLSADSTWIDLPELDESHIGAFAWQMDLPDGTYDFRVKSILGTQESGWTYATNQVVTNV
jgi:hypothetical protein